MKKGISKLLLIGISLTSFSVHAVDIARVPEVTDSLNMDRVTDALSDLDFEDQAELIVKTAVLKAIDIQKALGINSLNPVVVQATVIIPFSLLPTLILALAPRIPTAFRFLGAFFIGGPTIYIFNNEKARILYSILFDLSEQEMIQLQERLKREVEELITKAEEF